MSCSSCGGDYATEISKQMYAEMREMSRVQEASNSASDLAEMQIEQNRSTYRDSDFLAQVVDISV